MMHILLCISSQRAKFWTLWWILGQKKTSMPSCPELPVPNHVSSHDCIFCMKWSNFFHLLARLLLLNYLHIHSSLADWGMQRGTGKAGGGGFALATAVIRGGIRKYHLGEDPPCSFPPEVERCDFV